MSDDSTLCHVPPPYSLPRLPPLLPLSLILSLSPTFHVSALLPHRRRPLPVPPLPLPRQTAAAASLQTAAAASLAAAAADSSGLPAAECDEPDSAAAAGRVLASECRDCGGGGGAHGGGRRRRRRRRGLEDAAMACRRAHAAPSLSRACTFRRAAAAPSSRAAAVASALAWRARGAAAWTACMYTCRVAQPGGAWSAQPRRRAGSDGPTRRGAAGGVAGAVERRPGARGGCQGCADALRRRADGARRAEACRDGRGGGGIVVMGGLHGLRGGGGPVASARLWCVKAAVPSAGRTGPAATRLPHDRAQPCFQR